MTAIKSRIKNPLFFVRHGQSEGQINPSLYKLLGDENLELTPLGIDQAKQVGKLLASRFKKEGFESPIIFHAQSERTLATARHIATAFNGASLIGDEKLNKQSFGVFNGLLTSKERKDAYPELQAAFERSRELKGDIHCAAPQGESIHDVIERVSAFLQTSCAPSRRPVIAVTHGLQVLCADKIINARSDSWLLEAQDSLPNGHILELN